MNGDKRPAYNDIPRV